MSSSEDEVCRCRARSAVQAMSVRQPRMHFRGIKSREAFVKVCLILFPHLPGLNSRRKHELLTRSLRKMERTLDTVLRSIGNPGIASGMVSRSPSPSAQNATTQALLAASPSPPPASASSYQHPQPPGSPKLHSLPDNSLNPLGLLAEASLANRRAQAINPAGIVARNNESSKIGVASDNYFKPGRVSHHLIMILY